MGYSTYVTGEFKISPPLRWSEMKGSPFLPDAGRDGSVLALRLDEATRHSPDGLILKRTAAALGMRDDDEYRQAHQLVDEVQRAVDAFPGHTWSGRLDCEGEDNADMWRVVILAGRATRIDPQIIWPDGAEG